MHLEFMIMITASYLLDVLCLLDFHHVQLALKVGLL